jgi:NAD(P)H-quinone oxidoreductase subunit 5
VAAHARRALAPTAPKATVGQWALALAGAGSLAAVAAAFAWPAFDTDPRGWVAVGLLAVALAPLFAAMDGTAWRGRFMLAGMAVGVAALYAGWHVLFAALLPLPAAALPSGLTVALTLSAFVLLFVVQTMVAVRPTARFARALQAWAFAGFHLDELFTRATFYVWPPRHVRRAATMMQQATPHAVARAA